MQARGSHVWFLSRMTSVNSHFSEVFLSAHPGCNKTPPFGCHPCSWAKGCAGNPGQGWLWGSRVPRGKRKRRQEGEQGALAKNRERSIGKISTGKEGKDEVWRSRMESRGREGHWWEGKEIGREGWELNEKKNYAGELKQSHGNKGQRKVEKKAETGVWDEKEKKF